MKNKTATIIGATGLTGSNLLKLLQDDQDYSNIRILVRRPVMIDHPKVKVVTLSFSDRDAFKSGISGSDAVFCAIGTTNKKVKGDQSIYRKIDYDIPVTAAALCMETGCSRFVLVSSLGANSKSNNFYLKLKGEVEDEVCKMNINTTLIFRPSLILGKRNEFRFGELAAKLFMIPVSYLLPTKLRPIQAYSIAVSMLKASKMDMKGFRIYHYKEMMELINKNS